VLLPWFGLSGAAMAAAFEPIFVATSDWRRIYVDLPGTGNSPRIEPNSDAVLESVMATISATVGDAPVSVVGCSYGGYLAAGLARRRPAQVAGLLLVCSGVRIRPDQRDLSGVLASTPEAGWLDGVSAQWHEYLGHALGRQTASVAGRVAEVLGLGPPTDDEFLRDLRSGGYPLSDEPEAAGSVGPVSVVTGRRDRIGGYRDQFNHLGLYPGADYVALADAGHFVPFEQPDHFKIITLNWLSRI
jgi:pimeloyl-ACP methyl ester carboxylesterase